MKEKIVLHLWTCATIVFCCYYAFQMIGNTILEYKISEGSTLSIDGAGIGEIIFIASIYYLSKFLINHL